MPSSIASTGQENTRAVHPTTRVSIAVEAPQRVSMLGTDQSTDEVWEATDELFRALMASNTADAAPHAIDQARHCMLQDWIRESFPPPVEVTPSEEGGVGVTLLRGDLEYNFYFPPTGAGEYDVFRGLTLVETVELDEFPDPTTLHAHHGG